MCIRKNTNLTNDSGYYADDDATDTTEDSDSSQGTTFNHSSSDSAEFPDGVQPCIPHKQWCFPTRPLVKKKSLFPLPLGLIPNLHLPLPNEPGFQQASAVSEAVFSYLFRLQPIPDSLLIGYSPSDDESTTASRRFYVTQYYEEMMWSTLGSRDVKDEKYIRRSTRIQARNELASTSSGTPSCKEFPWYYRPVPEDDDSSS